MFAVRREMATAQGRLVAQMVFGRAFLLELERGNMENAKVFAKAFLAGPSPAPVRSPDAGP